MTAPKREPTPGRLPVVGLLGLTLELYETLAPGLRPARQQWVRGEVVPMLSRHATILFDEAVCRRSGVEETVRRFEAEGADALLVMLLSYAPSQMVLPVLQRTHLPIVLWNTQEAYAVDASFSLETMIDNHGVHGTQDLANVLLRAGVRFQYLTSHVQDAGAAAELSDFFRAAAALGQCRATRIGLLGHPFPGMGDFAVDTTQLASRFGWEWVHLPVEEFIGRAEEAPAGQAQGLVAEYRDRYAVAPDVGDGDLQASARAEAALRGLVSEAQLDALTFQFMALGEDERTPTLPFVAASRLMADGIGFAGEGDLIAAGATAFFNRLNPPASFTEMFTIDFDGNSVFLSHMGEANVAMARRDRKVPLVARPTPITRTRHRQLALLTSFEPGAATLMALAQGPAGCWRLIASPVDILDYGPLPSLCVPHSKIRPRGDVREFLTAYARAGGPHHNAVCFGDARRRLRFAAELMGVEYCEV